MEGIKGLLAAAIEKAQAEADRQIVWYNRETGEVFDSIEDAMEDAAEQYDYGDETNFITYMGFPNDELPYIEIEWGQLRKVLDTFGRSAA